MIYLDHAATSIPRRASARQAALEGIDALNPGRGHHRYQGVVAGEVAEARRALAALTGRPLVCFMAGATAALNQALLGWRPTPRRIALGPLVHNAVRRPAIATGAALWSLPADADGRVDVASAASQWHDDTDLVALSHGSNVNGVLQPIAELTTLAHARGARVLVDCAQTAGVVDLPSTLGDADMIAFSGHKGLRALPGVGVLALRERLPLAPRVLGGTGADALTEGMPDAFPARLEAGTLNIPGVLALGAAAREVLADSAFEFMATRRALVDAIRAAGVEPLDGDLPVVSVRAEAPLEIEDMLCRSWNITSRAGLHCAPSAHRTLKTFPAGTVRFSAAFPPPPSTLECLTRALSQLRGIAFL